MACFSSPPNLPRFSNSLPTAICSLLSFFPSSIPSKEHRTKASDLYAHPSLNLCVFSGSGKGRRRRRRRRGREGSC